MHRTRIKICGIRRVEDALLAARCGADAVGLVLYEGAKRRVSVDVATQIVRTLPPLVTPVALFVNATPNHIAATAREIGVKHVQLQGQEPADSVHELATLGFRVVKAVHVERSTFARQLSEWSLLWKSGGLAGIVLDTANTGLPGGSGVQNDWPFIAATLSGVDRDSLPPIIAAGGLDTGNVADVVRLIRPYAVDVSSGVEDESGWKSADQIVRFCATVFANS